MMLQQGFVQARRAEQNGCFHQPWFPREEFPMPYNFHVPHSGALSQYCERSVSSPTALSQSLLLLSFPPSCGHLVAHIRYKAWSDRADQTYSDQLPHQLLHKPCFSAKTSRSPPLSSKQPLPCERLPRPSGGPQCCAQPWCLGSPEAAHSQSRNTCI